MVIADKKGGLEEYMITLGELYDKLQEAVTNEDHGMIEKLHHQILNFGRDTSIDESFIQSIKGKTLGKNLKRIIKEDNGFSYNDYTKIVSSLITHAVIESELSERSLDDYAIKEMYILLGKLINKNEGVIDEVKEFVAERYEEFM